MRWPLPAWFSDGRLRAGPRRRRAIRWRARSSWPSASSISPTCPHRCRICPSSACTHSSAHTDLAAFRGQEVVVVGAGQSALESAALLHENGRKRPGPGQKAGHRLERPAAGPGPSAAEAAEGTRGRARLGLVHLVLLRASGSVPAAAAANQGVPGAHGAGPRRGLLAARAGGGTVPGPHRAHRDVGHGSGRQGAAGGRRPRTAVSELTVDHVIAATGYRINLQRLGFLPRMSCCPRCVP